MARALIFLADGHEEVEMLTEVDMLRRVNISIDMISITGDLCVTGSHGIKIMADKLISDLSDEDYDEAEMLILPGGMPGTLNLRDCEELSKRIMEFNEKGKYLAAVCAAPTVFGGLGLLQGKNATCFPGMEDGLTGANKLTDKVVTDGNIITSRGMGTCIEFAGEIIANLADRKTSDEIKKKIVYNI
ncbi:MAG: DJ-1/PfpI family protein [Lachnospiraceae bacterium]|nr:DJ-1/PfpI family protein [Lachnospiraceae bacterium]